MYESTALGALGWSDLPGYPSCATIAGGGIKRCFTPAQADLSCAQSCGCISTTQTCRTTSGNQGNVYCCPRDCPSTDRGCRTQSGLICDLSRQDIAAMTTAAQNAVWRIKDKLCSLRVDPGAVDGNADARFSEAVSAFQARRGLPQTGEPDLVTLTSMGFTSAEAVRFVDALTVVPDSGDGPSLPFSGVQIPWLALTGVTGAGIFMLYALKKHWR